MQDKNQQKLPHQTAIVTGASSGIGQGIAIELGWSGCTVIINYHSDKEGLKKMMAHIPYVEGWVILKILPKRSVGSHPMRLIILPGQPFMSMEE